MQPGKHTERNGIARARQQALRLFYPLLMQASKHTRRQPLVQKNSEGKLFQTPIYAIPITLHDGTALDLQQWQGCKILIVNTASHCGYTAQLAALQRLQDRFPNTLRILGVPSNDFKNQEPGTNEQIAHFCERTYGVTFPLAQKSAVRPGPQQHPLYQWLTQPEQNGWNRQEPRWNFCKYLIDEHGVLTHYFDTAVAPLGRELLHAVAR